MVIEHVFISVLPPGEVMARASQLLSARDFVPLRETSFPVGQTEWTALEMKRGRKNAARARDVSQLPQTVRIEYDRGRVTVAIAITPSAAWGGGGATSEYSKKQQLHAQLLNGISWSLETLLAHDHSGQSDYTKWDQAEGAILLAARKRRNRNLIILGIVLTMIVGVIVLIAVAARN